MATFKVLLDKRRPLKDNTYPLVVRVFNGRKFKDLPLKIYLKEADFDAGNQRVTSKHPNRKVINQSISKVLLKVQQTALNLELKEEYVSAEKIKDAIVSSKSTIDFFSYSEKIIAEMERANRYGNANYYKVAINSFKYYSGKAALQFKELNYELLIAVDCKMLEAGLQKNTLAAYHRAIRAIFNRAVNEELVDIKHYPYRKYQIKGQATAKRNISKEDIWAMANMPLKKYTQKWHARNLFLLSFCLRGMNLADMALIKADDIINGRLLYRRKKTHKLYNIKLTEYAKYLISLYKPSNASYILPILCKTTADNLKQQRKIIQQATKVCNKYLKRIGEELKLPQKLTTYVARHSFATIAKKMGYSKDLISESLGHSHGSRVTEVYLDDFDQDVIDDMNDTVCRFLTVGSTGSVT